MKNRISEEKEKSEKRFRLLKEQAEKRFKAARAGDLLSPRVKQLIKESDERHSRIQDLLTRSFERVGRMAGLPEEEVNAELEEPLKPKEGIDLLSIGSLHRLEQLDSYIRHSVVEVCFYNLKLFFQALPEKYGKIGFIDKVNENVRQIPLIKGELETFFGGKIEKELRIKSIFPDEYSQVMKEMGALEKLSEEGTSSFHDTAHQEELSKVVPQTVDSVMGFLGRVKKKLESRKANIVDLMEKVVSLHDEQCKQDGISLNLQRKVPEKLMLFGNGQELTNAFSELIANARKHGFNGNPDRKERRINIFLDYEDDSKRNLQVKISDNGVGIPEKQLSKIEYRGVSTKGSGEGIPMVKRIIENKHLGSLCFNSQPGQGTTAEVFLPIKLSFEDEDG